MLTITLDKLTNGCSIEPIKIFQQCEEGETTVLDGVFIRFDNPSDPKLRCVIASQTASLHHWLPLAWGHSRNGVSNSLANRNQHSPLTRYGWMFAEDYKGQPEPLEFPALDK